MIIGNGIFRDHQGQVWLDVQYTKWPILTPVALFYVFGFVDLHLYGGVYLDIDVLLLQDMRLLLLPGLAFANRWGALGGHREMSTAVLSLAVNSSLSSHVLRISLRHGFLSSAHLRRHC